jgi:hypothetical protein
MVRFVSVFNKSLTQFNLNVLLVFSLGMIIQSLFLQSKSKSPESDDKKHMDSDVDERDTFRNVLYDQLLAMSLECTSPDPGERITMPEIRATLKNLQQTVPKLCSRPRKRMFLSQSSS